MKLVLSLVSLSAMLLLLPGVYLNNPIPCPWPVPLSAADLLKMTKTKPGKCFYECMLRSADVVTEDAVIDVQKFMNKVKSLIPTLKEESLIITKEIMEKCKEHIHLSEDKCETTGFFLKCSIEESKNHGWDTYSMVIMLESIYKIGLRRWQRRHYKRWD